MKLLSRMAALLGTFLIALLGIGGTASAHAELVATTPGSFEVLAAAPHEVSLRFSESIDVSLAEVRLLGPGGAPVAGVGKPVHPAGGTDTIAATLPGNLANGTYTVSYRVVSVDSHPVEGAFAFSVGEVTGGVAAGQDRADGLTTVLYGVFRWIAYVGLALLVGTGFFVTACWPGGEAASGARRLLWAGWGILTGSTVVTFVLYGPSAAGKPIGDLADPALLGTTFGSRIGLVLVTRLVLLGVLAAVLVLGRKTFRGYEEVNLRRRSAIVLGAGLALVVTWSFANHSAAGTQVLLALPVDAIHLLAMAVWLGGLPVLLAVLLRSGDIPGMRIAIPRFSRIALGCVLVLAASGTYQAWREVGSPAALFGTGYGTVLAVKLLLVVVVVGLGAFARNWVHRQYGGEIVTVSDKRRARRGPEKQEIGRFRRMVTVEVLVAAAILGATAALVDAEPAAAELARAREEAAIPARVGPVNVVLPFDAGGGPQGVGKLAVLVTPGRVGRNEVHLAVLDANRRPKKVAELRAELRLPSRGIGPIPVAAQLIGGDHAIAQNAPIAIPGMWELAVTVRTSEIDQAVVRIPVGAR
ncbi:copper resistance CopC/CopD family protein [Amycolatopsis pithecellobii]|uniref:Copper-binding protein n=1 Tax=Amycolatopsis pithecellobii TaxID=664692 RepID=A0A6N7Z671_9PSEU|nr:copper resistance protein CopC [Amycolatopsis pithecellobii]MTD56351.1 copper-binding protein [Amycolatopsis pithecellobii]